jgi:TRAP transporter TAXI family solute receptor
MRRRILRYLKKSSPRDLFAVGLPLLLVLVAGFWAASRFVQPAPPDTLVLTTGGAGGAYQRFGDAYKAVLARYGIRVVEQPSAGSIENLARLRDDNLDVDAGFYQSGTGKPQEDDDLYSLGAFYYEPLWIFYRADLAGRDGFDRVLQLKGRRIAIGPEGSGTRKLALEVLGAGGIDAANAALSDGGGSKLADALRKHEIDAACVVGSIQAPAIARLLAEPGVRLMNLAHAEAFARKLPFLATVVLPRGAADLVRDIPDRDVTLVTAMSTLLVRGDTHPALVDLLMQAATETHGGGGVFQRPGEFPKAVAVDFPLSDEAARYYKSGRPFLQRYLPFWAAVLIDRMMVMLIPVIALLVPIMRLAPPLYGWRVRSRIFRHYGELKFLEAELEENPGAHTRAEWLARLEAIEHEVNHIKTPLAFSDKLYTLRDHMRLVRQTIRKRTASAHSSDEPPLDRVS